MRIHVLLRYLLLCVSGTRMKVKSKQMLYLSCYCQDIHKGISYLLYFSVNFWCKWTRTKNYLSSCFVHKKQQCELFLQVNQVVWIKTCALALTWLVLHRYLVSASFSEKTLRTKLPFLWAGKVEGMMAYSPGGSLKRWHTSRVLMKVLMATWFWRSSTSGPRWTLLEPLYWQDKDILCDSLSAWAHISLK